MSSIVTDMTTLNAQSGTPSPAEASGSIQHRTYQLLREMIADGRIAPGEKLLEAQVAKSFCISRSPARIALAALCADKIIVESEGRGYRVAGTASGERVGRQAVLDRVEITSEPQWQRMYAELERELCTRVLFGSVRITEEGLAQHFDVSRTIARGVMARMHSVGQLSKDRNGHWIAEQVTRERIGHLFEMRRLLEPTALMQAAPHVSRAFLEAARERLIGAIGAKQRGGAEMDTAETDLHIDLLSHCPNKEIVLALSRTHVLFVPTRYLSDPYLQIPDQLISDAFTEHLQIIDHILAGKPERAAQILQAHIAEADTRWMLRFEIIRRMKQPDLPDYLSPLSVA
ncbi:GntR family transcriptional regulator [Caballeronia insecticola]|uniref:Transcriptional regulator GntR family n=1 Tax=Caballeronia insecticola TaxID=758793 RepID=R4X3W1_9BURK|nr:GntR family transcriptional regulator [Caballeronia insecticola]BAN26757.1 transcriptional regulator GntR family [Caballeronia insecticola]